MEPGTPLADAVQRGIVTVLDDDAAADLYEYAIAYLAESGWSHYEVSNWARLAGGESVHNRIYWRNGEYLGVGAGAHGRIGNRRTMRHLLPATYIAAVRDSATTESNSEWLSDATQQGETMMLGLRLLHEGVTFAEFRSRHGLDLMDRYGDVVRTFRDQKLLLVDDDRIRLSPRGSCWRTTFAPCSCPEPIRTATLRRERCWRPGRDGIHDMSKATPIVPKNIPSTSPHGITNPPVEETSSLLSRL